MTDAFDSPGEDAVWSAPPDRYGRYQLPDPHNPQSGVLPWTRVTTVASAPADMWNLQQWGLRKTIEGIAQNDDLYALAKAHAHDSATADRSWSELNKLAEEAKERANARAGANRGTSLHAYVQAYDEGKGNVAPPAFRPHVAAYAALMQAQGFEVLTPMTEKRLVLCPTCQPDDVPERVAGRADRFVRCPDGVIRVVDLKTEKAGKGEKRSFEYSEGKTAIQLSCYAHAAHRESTVSGVTRWAPMPAVDLRIGYVVHVPAELPPEEAYAELFPVDLQAGWEGLRTAFAVRTWRRRKRLVVALPGTRIYGTEANREPVKAEVIDATALPPDPAPEPTPEPTPEPKHVPAYWARESGVGIVDADGWRCDGTSFDIPITRAEFQRRMSLSTVQRRLPEVWGFPHLFPEPAPEPSAPEPTPRPSTVDGGEPIEPSAPVDLAAEYDKQQAARKQVLDELQAARERSERAAGWLVRLQTARTLAEGSAVFSEAHAAGEWSKALQDAALEARKRIRANMQNTP